jgi:O-antigen ligase
VILGCIFRRESLFPRELPLTKFLTAIALVYLLSYCYGSLYLGVPLTFSFDDPRFENWINYLIMPGLYFVVACSIKDIKQMKILILLLCLSVFAVDWNFYDNMSGQASYHFSYELRTAGLLGYAGENGLAAFQAQTCLFVLALVAFEKKLLAKLPLVALLIASVYCLLFSFSRGAYIACGVGVCFFSIFRERKLIILLLALACGWQFLVPNAVIERVAMTVDESGVLDSSSGSRFSLWDDASQLFWESPLIGSGYDTYAYMRRVASFTDTHNMYLKILVEQGLVGMGLFLSLLFFAFRMGFRLFRSAQDPFLAAVGFGFAAMIVAALTVNFFGDRWTYLQVNGFLWTLMACTARGQMITNAQNQVEGMESVSIKSAPALATPPVTSW